MTKKIKWRLAERPTVSEVNDLFGAGILNKDEAREILFTLETEETRTVTSLQQEIKFLRDLVETLSKNRSVIIEHIKEIEKPYSKQPWYQPYYLWAGMSSNSINYCTTASGGSASLSLNATASSQANALAANFSDIKTF